MASIALIEEQLVRSTVAHDRAGPLVIVHRGYSLSVPDMTA